MTRQIIRITGEDRVAFLQGLVSNDVTRAPCWAALLTPQGKYLADFLIVPQGDALLVDVDARLAGDLVRRLSLYKLRSRVGIEPTDMTVARGTGPMPAGAIADPRHPYTRRLLAAVPVPDAYGLGHAALFSATELTTEDDFDLLTDALKHILSTQPALEVAHD